MKPPGAFLGDLTKEDLLAIGVKPSKRLLCCVPTPERDAVLARVHEELDHWPTYYLIHLLAALAAVTGATMSGQGDVSIQVAGGSLWRKLREFDAADGEDDGTEDDAEEDDEGDGQ